MSPAVPRTAPAIPISSYTIESTPIMNPMTDSLQLLDAYWRASNYLSVGQMYLWDNPLLRRPLRHADLKPTIVGHWGSAPGQNFVYVHLNRIIRQYDLNMLYISGPGHAGQAMVGCTYLEGRIRRCTRTSARTRRA